MVYVCQIGDGPDLRLFPDRHLLHKDDPTAFLKLKVRIPYTRNIPKLAFVETTKFARSSAFNEGGHIGEFGIAVIHPDIGKLNKIAHQRKEQLYCAFIYLLERGVEPVPHDKGLRGLGATLKYINAHRDEILEELRRTFGPAALGL